jgi:hypothetical protein
MASMQDDILRLENEMSRLMRENEDYVTYIHELERKQGDLISQHTLETGTLRKKITVLTNHIQSIEGAGGMGQQLGHGSMVAPGQFSVPMTAYGDMDGITMDGSWDTMPFGDFSTAMEQQPQPAQLPRQQQQAAPAVVQQQPEVKQETQIVPVLPSKKSDEDKPQQGGFLFMLFLVGAFVLSSRSTPAIPRVSEDIRAASESLLQNVLNDAGVSSAQSAVAAALAPQASGSVATSSSGTSWPPVVATGAEAVAPSMLVEMADALTQPTEQQTNEQLFSLTAAQYSSVVEDSMGDNNDAGFGGQRRSSGSLGRRNLADALAGIQAVSVDGKESVAEVYTRSLLWDQIPSDVVRSFAKMVAEPRRDGAIDADES